MVEKYQSEWSQYRHLVLAELERQNGEIKAAEEQVHALLALINEKEKELLKAIAKLETDMEVQKTKMAMIAFGLSTGVSLAMAVLKEVFIK